MAEADAVRYSNYKYSRILEGLEVLKNYKICYFDIFSCYVILEF